MIYFLVQLFVLNYMELLSAKKMDTVQNIVENLLKKNETLLAMSDASGFKPNARRVRRAHDSFVENAVPTFPSAGQASAFPVSHSLLAHVSESKETSDTQNHLIRPKSPTRRYDGRLKDNTHFSYALMESSAADHEIEKIFNVQNHELVCAISSKTLITDKVNKIVASLEFCYFWCNFCPFTTNSKSLLTQHVLEHRFCCKYCAYESFCRSDVVRHMHKMHSDFKNTARNLSYLTFLSDYLRVKSKTNEKENKNPDEDVNNIEKENIGSALLDIKGLKHKSVLQKDECVSNVSKAQRIDLDHGAENAVLKSSVDISQARQENISLERQETPRQSHSSYHPESPAKADYDIFYMEVEGIKDSKFHLTTDESNTKKCASSSNHTSTATSDKHSQIGTVHVEPHMQDNCLQTFTAAHNLSSSEICNTYQPRCSHSRRYRARDKSSLYWSCGYCTFQSSSQNEVKDHASKLHPGKPQRYVALIKNVASNSIVNKNRKRNVTGSSTATSRHINTSQPHVDHLLPNIDCLFKDSSDSKSDNATGSKNDTASLSEKSTSCSPPKLRLNSSTLAKKGVAVLKCFHCLYTSRQHWTMKNHIYHKHRGKRLVAVANRSPRSEIFFCARVDCTFHCEDTSVYLKHIDHCSPCNKLDLADDEVEPHVLECLDQTITLAEISKLKGIESKKSRLSKDDCNTIPEDVTESIHNIQLLLEGKSSVEAHPLWIQSSQSDDNHRVETAVANVVNKTVNDSKFIDSNTSENAFNHLCPQNLNSPVEFEHCSNNMFLKILPPEDVYDVHLPYRNQEADKLYVCNSSNQIDVNKHNSNFCTSAASKDKLISGSFVGSTASKVTHLNQHSKLGEILIDHSESGLAKPLTDLIIRKSRGSTYNLLLNEVALSQKVLTSEDNLSVLNIENNVSDLEILQQKSNNDHTVSHFMKCKDNSSAVNLNQTYTAKNVNNDESKLQISLLEKKDTSCIKSNGDAEGNKHGNPSLKIKFKMVGHAAIYNINNNTQQPEPSNTNKNIRASDSIAYTSEKCSDHYNEENNSSIQNDCTETSQIQNPWIKDLIDSTEESDSDQTFHSTDIYDSLNSVPDKYTNFLDYRSVERNSIFVSNPFKNNKTSNNLQEQISLCVEGSRNQWIKPGQVLTEESETAGVVIKPYYSFVPLRSAAVKAISKMKPLLTCETENEDSDFRNNRSDKKLALKHQLSCPSSYHDTNQKSSASRKRKLLSGHKCASKMSKSVYMCQYCIDISEGPLKKIKSHVLSKHSSMPPVVINSFKQRHHINCQFYICPYDSCYKLSRTLEESEAHKCTHEKDKKQQSSSKLFDPFSANVNNIKKAPNTKPVRACSVELNVLDMSQINSVGSVLIMPEKKKYQCLYCTSYYYDETLQGMKAHYFREHEGQLMVIRDTEARRLQLPSRIYVCDNHNCEQFYIKRSDLDSHANSHKSNLTYIYECASCGWYSASQKVACHHVKNEHADEEGVSLVHMQVSVDEYGQTSKIIL